MPIYLLDNTLKVDVCYEDDDQDYKDNIRICIVEECPDEEKIFIHDETNIYLTPDQANQLARLLDAAAQASRLNGSRADSETA
jgi:hypothetical protein